MAATKEKIASRRKYGLARPDMTPIAGVMLALVGFFLLTSSFREPSKGVVSLEETPRGTVSGCFTSPAIEAVVCLTSDGLVSFATTDPALQATVLQHVGKKYGIHFSRAQSAQLKAIPFLGTTIEQLPAAMQAPTGTYLASIKAKKYATLTDAQLADCVKAVNYFSHSAIELPASLSVLINAQTDASKVMHLFGLLQAQGIRRFNLVAHY